TVLNCSGSGQISLCGIGNTESTWDYIYIYAGVGTGGTLLASYTGTGQSISYTGAVGQALTIKFTSDGSTNYSGTYINVTYIANCCTPPTSQATSLSVTTGACGSTNLTATWTRGNGNNVLVVCTAGSASTGPTSGTAYTANTVYGSGTACGGGFCVYNGTGTSVTVTGLTAGNTYYIDVYEYLNASTCYLSPSLSGNVSIAAGGNNSCGCATDITSSFNAVSTAALVTTYSCSISGTNAGATADEASTSCFTNGQNVWYKFTPAYSGSYYAGVNSGSGTMDYPEVAILSGTCGGFTNLGCAGVTSTTKKPYGYYDDVYDPYYSYAGACNLVAGNTYYIMVDNAYGTSYRGTFTLTVSSLSNDGPSTAAILPSCGINYSSSTIGATNCNNCTGSGTSANNNLDCNASTSVGSGSGSDVYAGMTVENDSWYAFCTTSPGTYTLTLSAVDATCIGPDALTSSELQCNIYTGVGALSYTALGYQYGDYFGDLWDEVIPISLAANGCCWVEVDGYAGTNCDYTLNLTGACTLPIHLLNFTGENADNNKIRLKWSTASEEQNNHYLIERSADGFNYKHMAELKGAGTSSSRHDYETLDENPLDGVNYYRLTTIDLNGKADVASSIAVTHKAHLPSFSVYPNPAKNFMNVDMNNFSSSTVNLDVVDMYGRTVWSSELNTVDGGSKTQIDLSNFAGGMYFVKVYDGSNFYKKSVFVSKEN
ncbi:MAG: T9SS type A sorting domain-containing protein, partial [Bacteroidia bacterium]